MTALTSQQAEWRARAWTAYPPILTLSGAGRDADVVFRSPTVCGADMVVPHAWGIRICAGDSTPDPADAAAAIAWCRHRDAGHGWFVSGPAARADDWPGLEVGDGSGVFATDATVAAAFPLVVPDGVTLEHAPSLGDVRAAYGGWMDDHPLADLLVTADDLAHPDRAFVVAHVDGEPVGCAFVWWGEGTAYLSGIGVVERLRGRGIGNALTTAAAQVGATRPGTDVVWMFATPEGAALYDRMGFVLVDREVLLRPR
ncbi:GNAT family N-acetyltransferase [Longivirga aurantiaca]|uniref:GNAT family N-acetyltransferase n=1 Tax=Longivirga aurantiaca TaxID=1837743 RepID=A0ABW1T2S9_9ACTN